MSRFMKDRLTLVTNHMNWILSFFSGEAHITYLVEQLAKAQKSVDAAVANIHKEEQSARTSFERKLLELTERRKVTDKVSKILSQLQ